MNMKQMASTTTTVSGDPMYAQKLADQVIKKSGYAGYYIPCHTPDLIARPSPHSVLKFFTGLLNAARID